MSNKEFALSMIRQLRAGEWKVTNGYTLKKGDLKLWIANGAFFLDLYQSPQPNVFGYFWRHIVWWAGVRPFLRKHAREALYNSRKKMLETESSS
ncbi:hypothetical protein [Dongshaea marina]|uniref:hypothetical protein n=1 Tax=Dongshaea marina TaxID=2047966 RepID=UPI00131F1635|nr:hypothetical protein [Dongshaea marina]